LHLMPAKGMTLPFISYGGSSMISLAYGMGMLLALTRERPRAELLAREGALAAAQNPARSILHPPQGTHRVPPFLLAAGGTGTPVSRRSARGGAWPARHRRRACDRRSRRALRQDIPGAGHSRHRQRNRARPQPAVVGAHGGDAWHRHHSGLAP